LSRGQCLAWEEDCLHAERRSAPASALHIWVFKLKACGFQCLDVVHDAAVQVHERGSVNEDLKLVESEYFVHHARRILEIHRVAEAGASAADHADTQPGGH